MIGLLSLVSRLLGVLRDRILAGEFGAGATLDAYYAAFRIPDLLYNLLVVGALSAGFIPVFITYYKKSAEEAWELASGVFNLVALSLGGLGVIGWLVAPWLVPLIAPGFAAEQQAVVVSLSRIMFLSPLFLGLSAVLGGVLQSFKKFFVFSLAPIFYNIGIMFGALYLVRWWGVAGLAWGVVLGAGLHAVVQLPAVYASGFHWRPRLAWHHAGVREIMTLMVPRTLGLAIGQVNTLVMTSIASTLAIGSVAVLNFATNLQSFPLGIFGVSFAIALFPTLASAAARADLATFRSTFSTVTRQVLFFILPVSVLFLVLRAQITRSALGAGQFDWADTIATADTLALFAVSLFAQALIPLLSRGFYALHDTWTPFFVGLGSAAVNIVAAIFLAHGGWQIGRLSIGGVSGLAFAFSLSSLVNATFLWLLLRARVGGLGEWGIVRSLGKVSLGTVILAAVTQWAKFALEPYTGTDTFVGIFSQGLIAGLAGLVVFTLVMAFMRSEELLELIAGLKRRLFRVAAVPAVEEIREQTGGE